MKAELYDLLGSLGYEVYEQGSFTDEKEYPDSFFTVWNDDTAAHSHYNNVETATTWEFTIYFYSTSPLLCVDVINIVKTLLQKNRWIVPGKGRDAASDAKSHSGRMIEAYFIEKNEEEKEDE